MTGKEDEASRRVELDVRLDAHALEALQLEVRRLSRRHGLEVTRIEVRKILDEGAEGDGA
jgi:hypothetical protein